ncbi:MAG: phosphate ABC transporter permease PstA [Actinomycetia bacterium]|nr:phosphate ABC transporter permease PstA [Actinomycetes bacterium]
MKNKLVNNIAMGVLFFSSMLTMFILIAIIVYVSVKGIPVINWRFISTFPEGVTMEGGILPTIIATFYLTTLTMIIISPIAIGGAIYLSEYAAKGRLVSLIRFGADSLSSVPSIVFGLFGFAFFVHFLGLGYSMISGALTLSLMVLPVIMRTTEEAILSVPNSFREASFGLGASKWQTIKLVVLKSAMPRILTGIILGVGRALGETAAVIFTAGLAIKLPLLPTDTGRTMTCHLYLLATEGTSHDVAFGTAFLLLIMILFFNIMARIMAKRV